MSYSSAGGAPRGGVRNKIPVRQLLPTPPTTLLVTQSDVKPGRMTYLHLERRYDILSCHYISVRSGRLCALGQQDLWYLVDMVATAVEAEPNGPNSFGL